VKKTVRKTQPKKKAAPARPARKKPVLKKKVTATTARRTPAAKRTTSATPRIPTIGAPIRGGFFAGKFFGADGKAYGLIVAPKATGETELKFKTERTADTGARSLRDGYANSQALNDDAHPAAKFCRSLTIGGFKDWYLPSCHETALMAETLMPGAGCVPEQTTAKAFQEGGAEALERAGYWTSTEQSDGFAWFQYFDGGNQNDSDEDWSLRVRAVRKQPL
jgi:hypothetical protein